MQRVESFYKDIGNSRQMAGKKDSNKKCDDPMQILQFSLKEVYKNFVEQNDCPVSFSELQHCDLDQLKRWVVICSITV